MSLGCKDPFKRFGMKCYSFSEASEDVTWHTAKDLCKKNGTVLVTVKSKEIEDFLAMQTDLRYYLGAQLKEV